MGIQKFIGRQGKFEPTGAVVYITHKNGDQTPVTVKSFVNKGKVYDRTGKR